ncbi:MAG: hypothetical protein IT531_04635 [Burkholderiales bacterium]|nr:hypothetical protein [Burkholderiales bacterium]
MSLAAKLVDEGSHPRAGDARRALGARDPIAVARDLALMVGAALAIGLTVGGGMMLAVLVLA